MWLEELRPALLSHNVHLEEPLHRTPTAFIYRAWSEGQAVAVKIVQTGDLSVEQVESECRVMLALQHTAILKVYMCFWVKDNQEKDYFVMVLELCKSDLASEIKERANSGNYWPESEIWTMLITLVDALVYMQEQGIAHRDLKPGNLFLSETGLKLGDFGSAKSLTSDSQLETLVGSPLYMSPLLREGLVNGVEKVQHNPYKSDMYSLGVTFMYMCSLKPPYGALSEPLREVQSAGYSQGLTSILEMMTREEEEGRYDFIQLRAYLNPVLETTSDRVTCLNCQTDCDRSALESPILLMCNPSDHLFCSLTCYCKFKALQSNCPKCGSPLQPIDLSVVDSLERQAYTAYYWLANITNS
jgi:serine/threonine protein kinase